MKILILAPHPFYQDRGTPISVDLMVRALGERGDQVDVLTFHEGSDPAYSHLKVHRIRPILQVRNIRPGFSLKKIYCDIHLFFRFARLMHQNHYDVIHAVEESAFMALVLCPLLAKPFVCDVDSSMSTQLVNRFGFLRPFEKFLRRMEALPMRHARAVVLMCDALAREAVRSGAKNVTVLRDIALDWLQGPGGLVPDLRRELRARGGIAMYIGNLESYQGVGLMLESFAMAVRKTAQLQLVIIGGQQKDIAHYREMARGLGIADQVHFLGPRPVEQISRYMAQSDMLLSPRTEGVNTPMKIYTYLASGVPVLATDLPTHTQVIDSSVAMLAPPEKEAFAEAMSRLAENRQLGQALARRAADFIETRHSYPVFRSTLHQLYNQLEQEIAGDA